MAKERRPNLADVLSGRPLEHGQPLVLEISDKHHDVPMRFAQPGTIAMLVAGPRGEAQLKRIVQAVRAGDLEEVEGLHRAVVRQFGRSLLDPWHDIRSFDDIPVFTTFRYGRKTLRRGVCTTSGLLVARSLALYDGAKLNHADFDVVHHRRADAVGQVMAVVVIRQPRLTDLERKMITQIPEASAEAHFGEDVGYFTEVIVTRVAAHVGARAVDAAARELGIDGQINDVRNAANDIYTAAVNGAHDVAHEVAQELTVDGIINAAEAGVAAVDGVANAAEGAVNAAVDVVVDAVADAVGAAVDWVGAIFTANANDDAGVGAAGDDAAGAEDLAFAADADEGGDADIDDGGRFRNWADQIEEMAMELESLQPAAAVRELLALRARMISAGNVGQRISLRGRRSR